MVKKTARKSYRRKYVKRARKSRITKNVSTKVFRIKRTSDLVTSNFQIVPSSYNGEFHSITANGTYLATGQTGTGLGYSYFAYSITAQMDMLSNFTEFTALWDKYRITKLRLRLVPFQTTSVAPSVLDIVTNDVISSTSTPISVIHHSAIDYDDSFVFASSNVGLQKMREYPSYRMSNFFRKGMFTRTVYPKLLGQVEASGATTANSILNPVWLDNGDSNVPHYGFKGIFEVFAPDIHRNAFIWFRPELDLWLELKNPI